VAKAAKLGQIYVEINARFDRLEKDLKKGRQVSERQTKLMQRTFDRINFDRAQNSLRNFQRLLFTVAAGYGIKRLAQSAIETAASFEAMEIKLNQLTRGRGKETLDALNAWALEMPVNTQKVVDSFVMMQAMGLDPTIEKMQILTDVASIFGEDALQRVALQMGQMSAMGKLMGQELNVIAQVGIESKRYIREAFGMTVNEVQKAGIDMQLILKALWDGMERDFGGAAKKMMNSWQGLKTVFQSYVVELERKVMAAGVFDVLKKHLAVINVRLGEWIKNNDALIEQKVESAIQGISSAVGGLADAWQRFKSVWDSIPREALFAIGGAYVGGKVAGPYGAGAGGLAGLIYGLRDPESEIVKLERKLKDLKQAIEEVEISKAPGKESMLLSLSEQMRDTINRLKLARVLATDFRENIDHLSRHEMERLRSKTILLTKDLKTISELELIKVPSIQPLKAVYDAMEAFEWKRFKQAEILQRDKPVLPTPDEQEIARFEQYWTLIKNTTKIAEKEFSLLQEMSERTFWAMQQNFSDLFYDGLTRKLGSFVDYCQAIFNSIARAWADLMGQMFVKWIFTSIPSVKSSGFFSSILRGEKGLIFDQLGMVPFSKGGIVTGPTIFPFASGGVGLMGEKGPEAIMPLKRTETGELGVKTDGQAGVTNINIYAMDSKSFSEFADRNKEVFTNQTVGAIQRGNRNLISKIRMIK